MDIKVLIAESENPQSSRLGAEHLLYVISDADVYAKTMIV